MDRSPRTRIIGHGVGALRQSFTQAFARSSSVRACPAHSSAYADVLGASLLGSRHLACTTSSTCAPARVV